MSFFIASGLVLVGVVVGSGGGEREVFYLTILSVAKIE
jgi:hypothetical protein